MYISIVDAAIIAVVFFAVLYAIALIQKWWYKKHPYVSKEKTPYEKMVDRWNELHPNTEDEEENKSSENKEE